MRFSCVTPHLGPRTSHFTVLNPTWGLWALPIVDRNEQEPAFLGPEGGW
jgi:hypothetical protein